MPQKVLLRSGELSFKLLDGDYRGVSKYVRQLCGKLSRVPVQSVQGDFILIRLEPMASLRFDYLILLESLEVSKFVGQLVRGRSRLLGTRLNHNAGAFKKTTPDISTYAPAASGLGETASLTNAWSLFNPPIVSFPRSTLIALRPRFDSE